jgi:hypothetical protein
MPSSHSSERKANRADHRSDDWRPEMDILALWQAREVVFAGETVPTRTDVANIS